MNRWTGMLILAVVVLAGGCSIPRVPRVDAPLARVVGAELTEQTEEGAAFAVTVELSNPNTFALPVTVASYRVAVGGRAYSFTGVAGASMPPAGSQTLTLTGAVPNDGQDLTGEAFDVTGHVTYIKPGELRRVLIESGFPEPRLAFSGRGQLQ